MQCVLPMVLPRVEQAWLPTSFNGTTTWLHLLLILPILPSIASITLRIIWMGDAIYPHKAHDEQAAVE